MTGRRWLRAAVPFAAFLALVTGTLIAHAIEQPDPGDDAYLSPVSDDGIGSSALADRLRRSGVTIDRVTSSDAALAAVRGGGAVTLFVTTPGLIDASRLGGLPAGTRVVLVAPTQAALSRADWPVAVRSDRWTAAVADPGCADGAAAAAGPAAVRDLTYVPDVAACYGGSLITVDSRGTTLTVIGAADPFRNDRFAEHGNAALATGLLSATRRLVWLDVHEREKPPRADRPPVTRPTRPPADDGGGEEQQAGSPLADAFPPALWATLALLALALLALAAAAARRLGTPVAEPLPSRVPAFETVLGHARLYQRAGARGESLDILREAARQRIAGRLGLPAGASIADIAAAAGYAEADVYAVLGPGHPEKDDEFVTAAAAVHALERQIEGEQP